MHESFELEQYVRSFEASSNRVRYTIIVITIVSILSFVGYWNARPESWFLKRLDKAKELLAQAERQALTRSDPSSGQAAMSPVQDPSFQYDDPIKQRLRKEQFAKVVEEFQKAYLDNVVIMRMPFLGLSFDVNDLGILGGATLVRYWSNSVWRVPHFFALGLSACTAFSNSLPNVVLPDCQSVKSSALSPVFETPAGNRCQTSIVLFVSYYERKRTSQAVNETGNGIRRGAVANPL